MQKLTERSELILKTLLDEYIEHAVPISSQILVEKYSEKLPWSSALLRKEMVELEKQGYLYKSSNQTGGRIPTSKAYEYLALYLANDDDPKMINTLMDLDKIFESRTSNYEAIIDQALEIISSSTKMVAVSTDLKELKEKLINISLFPTGPYNATIVIVTSQGHVFNQNIILTKNINLSDLATCVNIFNERLVDIPIMDVDNAARNLYPVIKEKIRGMEDEFEQVVNMMFYNVKHAENSTSTKGLHELVTNNWESDLVLKVMETLQKNTIFDLLAKTSSLSMGSTKVALFNEGDENEKLAIFGKELSLFGKSTNLALVGSKNVNFSKVKRLLDWLENKVKQIEDDAITGKDDDA